MSKKSSQIKSDSPGCPFTPNSEQFNSFLSRLKNRYEYLLKNHTHFFTTGAENLWEKFIENIPSEKRQHYTCNSCKKFIQTYGNIVCLIQNDDNVINRVPVFWTECTNISYDVDDYGYLNDSINALFSEVKNATITGIFFSSEKKLGLPKTGEWEHIAVVNGSIFKNQLLTADQKAAEKLEDFKILSRGINEFSNEIVKQAVTILQADALYRSEKVLGVATWLNSLQEKIDNTKDNKQKNNIMWLEVAKAPPGFCHIRSTMINSLLEDLAANLPLKDVQAKFAAKLNPLKYQRPQAAPKEGNIKQAEKIIEKLNAEGALERRFATLDDIKIYWSPKEIKKIQKEQKSDGIFSHLLKEKKEASRNISEEIPAKLITWEKFEKTVLPTAAKIEYWIENKNKVYLALVTAMYANTKPIIQWDLEEQRNPVNCYVYHNGSMPKDWNLKANDYCNVTAITMRPSMWYSSEKFKHQSEGVIFILENCKDLHNRSLALFPEVLKSEFHEIRSTIEAFSRSKKLFGFEEANACGLTISKNTQGTQKFRVTNIDGTIFHWIIDRYE